MTKSLSFTQETMACDILDHMSEALIFADKEGFIRIWNPGAEALFGFSPEEAIGKSLDIIIPEKLRKAHWEGYDKAVAQGATAHGRRTMITRALHRNGDHIHVDMSFAVVRNQAGEVTGSVAVASDAGQRHAEEKDLRRRLKELEANRAA
ncbi:PAS domain S-box protein [Noviherbaspirillum malthae]|uniref:PAS domain S-box protein n=1 Tax=Noviherbaspirillum malthae TaxID=1260987 RepID=UPI001E4FBE42|nr:PAS domain S-box protein [Noviherbaspirillum malthae]